MGEKQPERCFCEATSAVVLLDQNAGIAMPCVLMKSDVRATDTNWDLVVSFDPFLSTPRVDPAYQCLKVDKPILFVPFGGQG